EGNERYLHPSRQAPPAQPRPAPPTLPGPLDSAFALHRRLRPDPSEAQAWAGPGPDHRLPTQVQLSGPVEGRLAVYGEEGLRTALEMFDYLVSRSYINENGCLIWEGPTSGRGYGVTCWQGKQVYVHRLIYQLEHPDETLNVIRHTCDTPRCWLLEHLRNGTTAENTADKIQKSRHIFGSATYNSKFTETDISFIRNSQLSLSEIARIYSVTPSNIHYIRAHKTWKHVT